MTNYDFTKACALIALIWFGAAILMNTHLDRQLRERVTQIEAAMESRHD